MKTNNAIAIALMGAGAALLALPAWGTGSRAEVKDGAKEKAAVVISSGPQLILETTQSARHSGETGAAHMVCERIISVAIADVGFGCERRSRAERMAFDTSRD